MHIRTVIFALAALLIGLFAALNWAVFTAPTALSLGVATVQGPLGLIMLALVGLLCVGFVVWALSMQASVLFESRRTARELQAQRDLADKAEASRFTELRQFMSAELVRVTQATSETRSNLMARLDAMEQRQRAALEQTSNTLSSYLGELEDRLEHGRLPPDVPRSDSRPL